MCSRMAKHSQDLIDLICISHSERIMCCKFTYWQDLATAASFVNTKLASLKVSPSLVVLNSPEMMPNACYLGEWSESGGAVHITRLHLGEANAMGTSIILDAISQGAIEPLGLGSEARADAVEGGYHGLCVFPTKGTPGYY